MLSSNLIHEMEMNIAISTHYYTVPLRSVLTLLGGKNRKGAVFVGR